MAAECYIEDLYRFPLSPKRIHLSNPGDAAACSTDSDEKYRQPRSASIRKMKAKYAIRKQVRPGIGHKRRVLWVRVE